MSPNYIEDSIAELWRSLLRWRGSSRSRIVRVTREFWRIRKPNHRHRQTCNAVAGALGRRKKRERADWVRL